MELYKTALLFKRTELTTYKTYNSWWKDLSKSVHKLSVDELVTLRSEIDEAIFNKTVATWKY